MVPFAKLEGEKEKVTAHIHYIVSTYIGISNNKRRSEKLEEDNATGNATKTPFLFSLQLLTFLLLA